MPGLLYPTLAPIPARPVTLTFGSYYPYINQQEEAEAQEENEEAGSKAETLEEGLRRTWPYKRRGQQKLKVQDRRDTGEEERSTRICQGWRLIQVKLGGCLWFRGFPGL